MGGRRIVDFYINLAISVTLQALQDRGFIKKYARAFAKVFVRIERAAELSPELHAAIEEQRERP